MSALQRLQIESATRLGSVTTSAPDEREELLARAVAQQVRAGWRLHTNSRFQAVLVRGKRPNHKLHLALAVGTLGLWGLVWLAIWIFAGEQREVLAIDEHGHTNIERQLAVATLKLQL